MVMLGLSCLAENLLGSPREHRSREEAAHWAKVPLLQTLISISRSRGSGPWLMPLSLAGGWASGPWCWGWDKARPLHGREASSPQGLSKH